METQLLNLQEAMISRKSSATKILLQSSIKGLGVLLSLLLIMTFSSKSFAQMPTTAGWGFTVTPNVQLGNVTAYPATVGSGWGGTASAVNISNTYTYTTDATAWLSPGKISGSGSVYNPNAYIEYKVAPTAGNTFDIKLIRLTAGIPSTSGGRMAIYYSIDNDANSFANPTDLGTATLGSSPVSRYSTSSIAAPMPLLRTDSIGGRTYPMDITGSSDITYSPNITVPDGKTFTIRIYAWSIASAQKALCIRNLVISSGSAWPVAVLNPTTTSAITTTTVTLKSAITATGGDAVAASGFVYSDIRGTLPFLSYSSVLRTVTTPLIVNGVGTLEASVTDLKPGTTYYARSYSTGVSSGTSYGQLVVFTTPGSTLATRPSVIATSVISGVVGTNANTGGTVSSTGGSSLTATGVVWSTTSTPASTDIATITNKTNDLAITSIGTAFVSSITGLIPSTKYFVRSYATNNTGTTYGPEITFYSASGITAPSVVTTGATISAGTSATFAGEITGVGTTAMTAIGFVWGTVTAPTTALTTKVTSTLVQSGVFTGALTGLVATTPYYVRAYVTNGAGTFYGNEIVLNARLSTTAAATITANSATLAGSILALGGATTTATGVVLSTSTAPTLANTVYTTTAPVTTVTTYSLPVTGLSAATKYFIRAYATTATGTIYGNELNFSTLDGTPSLPVLTTNAVSIASASSAVAGGTISSNGGGAIIATGSGVVWSTASSPTIASLTKTTDGPTGGATGFFNTTMASLIPGTTYYIKAYATNAAGTAYGNEVVFNFPALAPTLSATTVSSITSNTAIIGGSITSSGGSVLSASGFVWGTILNPTLANTVITSSTTDAVNVPFSANLTALTAGVYHARSYATSNSGTVYGADVTITISAVATAAITNIIETSATSGANIGAAPTGFTFSETGLVWGTTSAPTTANTTKFITSAPVSGDFTTSLTSLTGATKYYVRGYASYIDPAVSATVPVVIYGNELNFTTPNAASPVLPTVTTLSTVSLASGAFEATCGGSVTSTGGSPITLSGLVWSTSAIPDGADLSTYTTKTVALSTSTTIFSATGGPTIYLRAYAVNSVGTSLGNQVSFAPQPYFSSISCANGSSSSSTAITINSSIVNNSPVTVSASGIVYGTATGPTTSNTVVASSPIATNGNISSAISGLVAGTTYYIRTYITTAAYAATVVNGVTLTYAANASIYGPEITYTPIPATATAPILVAATNAVSLITQSSARSGGSITFNGGAAITESGIVWGTTAGLTIANGTKVITNPLVTSGAYDSNISGLSPGTTYFVRSYATNSVNTTYGTEISFTTLKVAPVLANTIAATGVVDVSASVGGNLTSTGGNVITESGIVYGTSANPTISDSKTTTATPVSATGIFNVNLSGLTPNTTYYARSYVNTSGFVPVYGTQISFTTTSLPTTVGWALYNLTASTIQPTTQIGNIVALPMNTGSEWTGPSTANISNTNNYLGTVSGTQNTTWYTAAKTSGIGAVYSPNKYLEFKVTANGNDFKINTLQFSAHEQSGSGGKLAAYYSIDNDATSFLNSSNLGIATLGNTLASTSTSTIAAPIPLLRSDSLSGKTYPLTVTGSEDIKFSPNIVLANGKTFTLRIYSWSALSPDKSLDIRNVIMTSGTKWPVSVLDASTVSAITATTATVGSNIVQNGGDAIIASGIVYSTGLNFYPTLSNSKVATSPVSSTGAFSVNLPTLTGATKYLVRSYATNASGYTAYGPLNSFITTDASTGATAPTLSATTAASSITSTSAVSGGNISGSGGSSITASGIVWGITATPDLTLSTKTVETTNVVGTPFVSSVTGLNPVTLYYVRSYATNAIGTTYGTAISFTTAAATVTTDAITAITNTTATAGGNIVSNGGNAITESGVVYATTTAPTIASTRLVTSPLATTGTFVSSLTGLTAATKYFVRSYVINTVATVATTTYGPEVSFTSANDVTLTAPVLAATTVSGATATTATATVVITSNGGSPILTSGVVWSTTSIVDGTDVTTISNRRTNGSGAIINLTPYTLYYARSYASNAIGTTLGAEFSFNSLNAASTLAATTIDGATITSTGGTANSSIVNNGATITESGFVIGTVTAPTTTVTATNFKFATSPLATSGNISNSLTGLTAGTTYYVRSYVIYSASVAATNVLPTFSTATFSTATVYGAEVSFATNPAVATAPVLAAATAASLITQSSARTGGSITSSGGAAITESGIVWGTATAPTTTNTKVVTNPLVSFGAYISDIIGLNPGTTYYVRSYATNSVGTGYGTEINFTTSKVAPVIANTLAATSIADVTAIVGGNLTSTGGTGNITESGIVYSTTANPTILSSKTTTATAVTAPGTFNVNLAGLTASTTYYARSYVTTPGFGTFYGAQISFTTTAAVLPLRITSFTAKAAESGVALKWTTASEVNVKGFEVERRTANSNFAPVSGLIGAGLNTYSFIDQNVQNEVYYYRIKASDLNGDVNYSDIVAVTFNLSTNVSVQAYPNPATDRITITHQAATNGNKVQVLGLNGSVYISTLLKVGGTQTSLDVSKLDAGVYIILINEQNKRSSIKFIKN